MAITTMAMIIAIIILAGIATIAFTAGFIFGQRDLAKSYTILHWQDPRQLLPPYSKQTVICKYKKNTPGHWEYELKSAEKARQDTYIVAWSYLIDGGNN